MKHVFEIHLNFCRRPKMFELRHWVFAITQTGLPKTRDMYLIIIFMEDNIICTRAPQKNLVAALVITKKKINKLLI